MQSLPDGPLHMLMLFCIDLVPIVAHLLCKIIGNTQLLNFYPIVVITTSKQQKSAESYSDQCMDTFTSGSMTDICLDFKYS